MTPSDPVVDALAEATVVAAVDDPDIWHQMGERGRRLYRAEARKALRLLSERGYEIVPARVGECDGRPR